MNLCLALLLILQVNIGLPCWLFIWWNYWIVYMLASMAELAAISVYLDFWLPGIPHWMTTLACITLVTAINLINVRAYGEVEFFASLIKVVAIIAMIGFGIFLIFFGDMGTFPQNFSNLWVHGGLFPMVRMVSSPLSLW